MATIIKCSYVDKNTTMINIDVSTAPLSLTGTVTTRRICNKSLALQFYK